MRARLVRDPHYPLGMIEIASTMTNMASMTANAAHGGSAMERRCTRWRLVSPKWRLMSARRIKSCQANLSRLLAVVQQLGSSTSVVAAERRARQARAYGRFEKDRLIASRRSTVPRGSAFRGQALTVTWPVVLSKTRQRFSGSRTMSPRGVSV